MAAAVEDATSGGGNGTSVTVTRPAGASDGSRLLIALNIRGSYTITSVDADCTLLASIDTGGGGYPYLLVYEFTRNGGILETADTSWSFTISSGNNYQWAAVAISGSDGDYGTPATTDTGTGTSHGATGVTVPGADDAVLAWFAGIDNTGPNTWTPPSGYTEVVDDENGGGTVWPSIEVSWDNPGSGATGTLTATASDSLNGGAVVHYAVASSTGQALTASKLTVTPSFYGPTVTNLNTLSASALTVTPTFHGPTATPIDPTFPQLVQEYMGGNPGFLHEMDEASGNPVDFTPNSNDVDGSVGTFDYSQTGRWAGSSAIGFNYGDYFVHWNTSYAPDVSAAFTVGAFLRVNSFTGDSINNGGDIRVMARESWGTNGFRLWARANNGGVLDELHFSNSATRTGASQTYGDLTGEWVHVVGRYNGTDTLDLFVDGVKVATATHTLTAATAHLSIGGGWNGTGGDATVDFDLDGVFFVEHAMEDAEILALATFELVYPTTLTVTPTFYGPTVTPSSDLAPSLLTVTPSFHGPTVTPSNDLAPSLLTASPTFYGPIASATGLVLQPTALTVTPSFYSPTVAPGAVTAGPSLLTFTPTFYGPTVAPSNDLEPSLLAATPSFYGPTVIQDQVVTASALTVTPSFYGPQVGMGIGPGLLTVTPTFHAQTITQVQPLTVDATSFSVSFYGPLAYTPGQHLTLDKGEMGSTWFADMSGSTWDNGIASTVWNKSGFEIFWNTGSLEQRS